MVENDQIHAPATSPSGIQFPEFSRYGAGLRSRGYLDAMANRITSSTAVNLFIASTLMTVWGETWSLTLIVEHGLRLLENRVLRRIFGSKRDEASGR
jgi:hypothetical protein